MNSTAEIREVLDGGRLRGGIFRAHIQWVRDHHGDSGLVRLWSALPVEASRVLDEELSDAGLFPFRLLVTLDRAIGETFGTDVHETIVELGRYSARINLTTSFNDFNKHHPHEFFAQAARLHSRFQDFGRAVYEKVGHTSCRLRMLDYPCFSPIFCASALGYYAQATELQGGSDVVVTEESCQCDGAAECDFSIRWS